MLVNAPSGSTDPGGAFPRFRTGRRPIFLVSVLSFLLLFAAPAGATWSIVGVDPETDEVGVAIASCVPGILLGPLDEPLEPVALVPGVGAGVSQAALNGEAPPEIRRLISAGMDADGIVSSLTAASFDDRSQDRQHAVVLLDGDAAGFTGTSNQAVALHRRGTFVQAQGNILVSEAVVEDAIAAFEVTEGDLTSRLVAALQAGADAGGDARCGEQTALFAHVAVAGPQDDAAAPGVLLSVSVVEGEGANPVDLLSVAYAAGERRWVSGPTFLEAYGPALAVVGLGVIAIVGVGLGIRHRRRAN
jgi:uncharacterized Ntn-hydrolase superfamily protein